MNPHFFTAPFYFTLLCFDLVHGSGLARGAARPLIVDESFARQLGVRS